MVYGATKGHPQSLQSIGAIYACCSAKYMSGHRENSLLRIKMFAVPLRMEFRCESLNSLLDWTPELQEVNGIGEFAQIPRWQGIPPDGRDSPAAKWRLNFL